MSFRARGRGNEWSREELQDAAVVRQDALIAVAMAMAADAPGQIPGSGLHGTAHRRSKPWEERRASFFCNTIPTATPTATNRSASARRPAPNEVPQPTGTVPARDSGRTSPGLRPSTRPRGLPLEHSRERRLDMSRRTKLVAKNTFVSVVESDTSDSEPPSGRRPRSL